MKRESKKLKGAVNMKTSLAASDRLSIADAITDDEALALEEKMLNFTVLRCKIRASLKNNGNRDFLVRHL